MDTKVAYISITVLETVEDNGVAERFNMTFEEYAQDYANRMAQQIELEGFAVNDVEVSF